MTGGLALASGLAAGQLRILAGLYLAAGWLGTGLKPRHWAWAALGGCLAAGLGAVWGPWAAAAAESAALAGTLAYALGGRLRLCLFLAFLYEAGAAQWEFLLSAGLGILTGSAAFVDPGTPQSLAGIWLTRLCLAAWSAGEGWVRSRRDGGSPAAGNGGEIGPPPAARRGMALVSALAVLGLIATITLSEQTALPLKGDRLDTWVILSMVLLFAVLFYRANRQREMEAEIAALKEERAQSLEREFQTLRKTYSDNAKLYHDWRNHLQTLHSQLERGEAQEALRYCRELCGPLEEAARRVWTGDGTVDYLINSKIALAEQKGLAVKVNIEYPPNTNIRHRDLTSILGNLLDNAIEGGETAGGELRFLRLTLRRINDMLVIKVENGCGRAPLRVQGQWRTAKADPNLHGWGLQSVSAAAQRYDGVLRTAYSRGVFQAVVTLSYRPLRPEGPEDRPS